MSKESIYIGSEREKLSPAESNFDERYIEVHL